MVEEQKIDTNLYSRQIGTFGLETMGKLVQMKVLIMGLRGLGVETAKNLILAGPKQVALYDPTLTAINDLSSNFYLNEAHVGKTSRADACVQSLRELNPYVSVDVVSEVTPESAKNFNVVVFADLQAIFAGIGDGCQSKLYAICDAVRSNNGGVILAETLGACGYVFLDYGPKFQVNDADGEQTKQFIITHISQDEKGIVTVHEDKRHSFQDGDYVKFTEVEGMTQLNDHEPIKISVNGPYSFTLDCDTRDFGAYTRQGVVENTKVPQFIEFKPLLEAAMNPGACSPEGFLQPADMKYFGMGRPENLHVAIMGLHTFSKEHNRYPATEEEINQAIEMAKGFNSTAKLVEQVDEELARKLITYARYSISPMAAFFGGIVAQEVVKFTGKYMPLRQWLHYDIFEALPEQAVDRNARNSRYDDQACVFGWETQEQLLKVKTFMVGAGALGCELIKAFALMGIGCGEDGSVTCTDNDNIEVSNLNRQFLFRKNNVGHSKSETATNIAKQMNPALKARALMTRVGPDTEEVFNDAFWESLDFVVNAVDNIKARQYVDQRCVWYEKPLLESGTLGTKANMQMVVPHQTQCYSDSQDPPEESIPMCTMRNFPNQIEHCIEWGRDQFNTLFTSRVQDAIEFVKDPVDFVAQLRKTATSSSIREQLTEIRSLIEIKQSNSMQRIVEIARGYFETNFDHKIRDLKALFPDDKLDSEGQPFWSGPKRSPQPITFSAEDPLHFSFVFNAANLIAVNLCMEPVRDEAAFRGLLGQTQATPYVQKLIAVETPEEAKAREEAGRPAPQTAANSDDDDEPVITELLAGLQISTQQVKADMLVAADFEKDDDSNFHIDYINATSNLRARNYKITECDRNKTKMIAGKIIPAIATTTAMITGAVCAEIIKFAQGHRTIGKFKNTFINLALPLFLFSEPDDVKKMKSVEFDPIMCGPIKMLPEGFTCYDKVTINEGSMTFGQLFEWLKTNKGVEISMVTCGAVALYNMYLPGNKHAPRLEQKVEDVYKQVSGEELVTGRNYLQIEVGGTIIESGEDFQMPPIKYVFM